MNEQPRKLLLRRGEVIEWTGISAQYLEKLAKFHIIRVRQFQPGGHLFYYREDIQDLLDYRGEDKRAEPRRTTHQ